MENSTLVGKNINQAGLQSIKDVTLFEIWRSSEVIPAPSDDVVLMGGDILFFCGPIGVLHKVVHFFLRWLPLILHICRHCTVLRTLNQ